MEIAFFDSHPYDKEAFDKANLDFNHKIKYFEPKLNSVTAALADGTKVVCIFVNDRLDRETIESLQNRGCKLVALRSAGFNNVDLKAASEFGLRVVRVPEYSPYAVAEHVVALMQTLNRKIHRSFNRVREGNFSLNGLVGFDLHGKTVGIMGAGKIGKALARIMDGFGCRVLLYDKFPDEEFLKECNCSYTTAEKIFQESDIISLNLPLHPDTRHFIDEKALYSMKKGVMIINTGRGALIDTSALIKALKSGQVGAAGLDVYEEEEKYFFQDLSGQILTDDVLARLLTFPNVIITSHQGFLTHEALHNIARTTLQNISDFEKGLSLKNEVK